MDLKIWADEKGQKYNHLIVVSEDSEPKAIHKVWTVSDLQQLAELCEQYKLEPNGFAVYISHHIAKEIAEFAHHVAHDVTYELPFMRPLFVKVQEWIHVVKARGSCSVLIIVPKDRLSSGILEIVNTPTDITMAFFVEEPGNRLNGKQDEYDDVFIAPTISRELRVQAEVVGKRVWVEDQDEPSPKGIIPRAGDAVLGGVRVPSPIIHIEEQKRLIMVTTTIDMVQDHTCLNELWSSTDNSSTHLSLSPSSPHSFPMSIVSRNWTDALWLPKRAHLTFGLRLVEGVPGNADKAMWRMLVDEIHAMNARPKREAKTIGTVAPGQDVPFGTLVGMGEDGLVRVVGQNWSQVPDEKLHTSGSSTTMSARSIQLLDEEWVKREGMRWTPPAHPAPIVGSGEVWKVESKAQAPSQRLTDSLIRTIAQMIWDATKGPTHTDEALELANRIIEAVILAKSDTKSPHPTIEEFSDALALASIAVPFKVRHKFGFDKRFDKLCARLSELTCNDADHANSFRQSMMFVSLPSPDLPHVDSPTEQDIQAALDKGRPPELRTIGSSNGEGHRSAQNEHAHQIAPKWEPWLDDGLLARLDAVGARHARSFGTLSVEQHNREWMRAAIKEFVQSEARGLVEVKEMGWWKPTDGGLKERLVKAIDSAMQKGFWGRKDRIQMIADDILVELRNGPCELPSAKEIAACWHGTPYVTGIVGAEHQGNILRSWLHTWLSPILATLRDRVVVLEHDVESAREILSTLPTIREFGEALELAALMLPSDSRRAYNFDKRFAKLCKRFDEMRKLESGTTRAELAANLVESIVNDAELGGCNEVTKAPDLSKAQPTPLANDAPNLLPTLHHIHDLEAFEGPILSEYRSDAGNVYVEKWCAMVEKEGVKVGGRWLVVRVNAHAIADYVAKKITMLELLVGASDDVGFLVDRVNNVKKEPIIDQVVTTTERVQAVRVSSLPASYLPKPTARHDDSLRPSGVLGAL